MTARSRVLFAVFLVFFGLCPVAAGAEPVTCEVKVRIAHSGKADSPLVKKGFAPTRGSSLLRSARFVDSAQDRTAIGTPAVLVLRDHSGALQRIEVLPHQVSPGRVRATFSWKDSSGVEVVRTKMGVPNGKNIILGNDGHGAKSVVVHVQLFCG